MIFKMPIKNLNPIKMPSYRHRSIWLLLVTIQFISANLLVTSQSFESSSGQQLGTSRSDSNSTQDEQGVLILLPSGVNITELQLGETEFDLLRLDSGILWSNSSSSSQNDENIEDRTENHEIPSTTSQSRSSRSETRVQGREGRKINLLKNIWGKPKVSPLYLINGTVCRFVNSSPICTTLATTGLLPASSSPSTSAASGSRPTAAVQQGGGSSVQFANQQVRPAAILDDEVQDINVESVVNTTDNSLLNGNQLVQQQTSRPTVNTPQARPLGMLVARRPINIMGLRRPGQRLAQAVRIRS